MLKAFQNVSMRKIDCFYLTTINILQPLLSPRNLFVLIFPCKDLFSYCEKKSRSIFHETTNVKEE